jgi:uncharacterized membrane protein YedE/YeeE
MPETFTPIASLLGGMLIGLAAVILMASEGRVAGISGIAARLLPPWDGPVAGRAAFLGGLIAAPVIVVVAGGTVMQTVSGDLAVMAVAGLLVGAGTVIGRGCTSGHGVCGLSLLSVRSLAATLVFMAVAAATVFVARHLV